MWRCTSIVLLALILAACSNPFDPCAPEKIQAYGEALAPLLQRYAAQLEVASATPRMGLGPVLQGLLDSEQPIRDVKPPDCLRDYHAQVLAMMDSYRGGFTAFAAQQESTSNARMSQAMATQTVVIAGMEEIRQGRVPVLP